jgi:flagella basal body P-ring formation protein FlgA
MKLLAMLCAFALAVAGGSGGDDKDKTVVAVKLRHAAAVRGMDVTIGDLCELPGDAAGAALARVRFGAAPNHGFTRTVARTDIVQALAAAGVDLTKVKVEGADEAVLQTVHVEVSGQELLEAATAALQAQLTVEGGDVEFEPTGTTRVVHAPPGRQSQDLSARLRGARTAVNSAVVEVDVLVDGESFRKVPVTFRLQRFHNLLKTVGTVRAGTPLGPESIALVREPLDQQTALYLDRMDQIEGLVAARNLQPNQRLTLGDCALPAAVHRGDVVTVVLTRGRVKVTARAIANHDAPLGGRITLTNAQSRSTLTGVVQGPGLVVVPQ